MPTMDSDLLGVSAEPGTSYAAVAEGNAYHEGHLYPAAWTAATEPNKNAALVMATRIIDATFRFNGYKTSAGQALQWPRRVCPDVDSDGISGPGLLFQRGSFLSELVVPPAVISATCELARELLLVDRTAAAPGEGLGLLRLEGSIQLKFDAKNTPPIVPRLVQTMLGKLGEYIGRTTGSVRLQRV